MIKLSLKLLVALAIVGVVSSCSNNKKKSQSKSTFQNDRSSEINYTLPLSFVRNGDTLATITVAIANSAEERDAGLMDVHHMAENKGMLFVFNQQQPLSFWMVNTPLSLDIIFVNKNHKIVRIHHSTQPFSRETLPSGQPALYAVETNAGFSVAHDILVGTKVVFNLPADSTSNNTKN